MLALALCLAVQDPQLRLPTPATSRCFVLEQGAPGALTKIGWARFLDRENERGRVLECEWAFLRPQQELWRVRHVEELGASGQKLVWRERAQLSGRTLFLEELAKRDCWQLTVHEREDRHTRSFALERGALMPLYLLELCRSGALVSGIVQVFDPLEASLVQRKIQTRQELAQPQQRRVDWLREDGSCAFQWCFEGSQLVAFQWNQGGPRARWIAEDEYQAAVGEVAAGEGLRANASKR